MKSQGREEAPEACETRSHQEMEGIQISRSLEEDIEEGKGRRPQVVTAELFPSPDQRAEGKGQ